MHDGFRNNYSVINCGGHLREKGKKKKRCGNSKAREKKRLSRSQRRAEIDKKN